MRGSSFAGIAVRDGPLMELSGVPTVKPAGSRISNAKRAKLSIATDNLVAKVSGNATIGGNTSSVLTSVDLR